LNDLALAQACSRGETVAWELFTRQYRPKLYAWALVIAKNEDVARELSDSIAGELFESPSRLRSYSGRGSFEGWLKAILSHAYVDRYRQQRKFVSLDDALTAIGLAATQDLTVRYQNESIHLANLHLAIKNACLDRTPEQQFLLAARFFDGWTLAEIAKRLDVHESTVSRRMNKTLRDLRRSIIRNFGKSTPAPDAGELPFDLRSLLMRGFE
jgi:RNA polymerase sigma-70 factor (ECF subfamily)